LHSTQSVSMSWENDKALNDKAATYIGKSAEVQTSNPPRTKYAGNGQRQKPYDSATADGRWTIHPRKFLTARSLPQPRSVTAPIARDPTAATFSVELFGASVDSPAGTPPWTIKTWGRHRGTVKALRDDLLRSPTPAIHREYHGATARPMSHVAGTRTVTADDTSSLWESRCTTLTATFSGFVKWAKIWQPSGRGPAEQEMGDTRRRRSSPEGEYPSPHTAREHGPPGKT